MLGKSLTKLLLGESLSHRSSKSQSLITDKYHCALVKRDASRRNKRVRMLAGNSICATAWKDFASMFPREYYRESPANSDKELGETLARVILTGYGQPFWKGLKHNGSAGNGITVSWTMETLYAPLLARQIWKGRERLRLSIYLLTYTYHILNFYFFLSGMKPDFTYRCFRQGRPIVLFCRTPIALKNTLILLFEGNSEFNSIAINYSSVVKKDF